MILTKKQRTIKMSAALAIAFVACIIAEGVIMLDTVMLSVVNMMMSLSASGATLMLASYNIVIILLSVMMLCMSFSIFAGHSGSAVITIMGFAGLVAFNFVSYGQGVAIGVAFCLLPSVILCLTMGKKAPYKEVVSIASLVNFIVLSASLALTIVNYGAPLTVAGFKSVSFESITALTAFYKEAATMLPPEQLETVGSISAMYTTEGSMAVVLNVLPAILIISAMLISYWCVTYYMKANNRTVIRVYDLTATFSVTKVGAVLFFAAAVGTWFLTDAFGAMATNLLAIQTLPLTLVGMGRVGRITMASRSSATFFLTIGLLLFMPLASIIFFVATFGAFEILFSDIRLKRGDEGEK